MTWDTDTAEVVQTLVIRKEIVLTNIYVTYDGDRRPIINMLVRGVRRDPLEVKVSQGDTISLPFRIEVGGPCDG